jgi:transposase-like protein
MVALSLQDFNTDFPDDETCLEALTALMYPDGITCRACGEVTKHHRLSRRPAYSCNRCGTHVYPLAGTIFAKSSTPLKTWLYAIYILSSSSFRVSVRQLQHELGVTYKTAWRMYHHILQLKYATGFEGTVYGQYLVTERPSSQG